MTRKVSLLGALAALASIGFLTSSSLAVAGQRTATACSTKGLAFSAGKSANYKVVHLAADGVPCTKARTVAQQVALQLLHNKPISLDGVSGLGMSTTMCLGCGGTTTKVSLSYPNGKITVSLTGSGSGSSSGSSPVPTIPSTPTTPSPSHTITV